MIRSHSLLQGLNSVNNKRKRYRAVSEIGRGVPLDLSREEVIERERGQRRGGARRQTLIVRPFWSLRVNCYASLDLTYHCRVN